jgi:hypothetical protein
MELLQICKDFSGANPSQPFKLGSSRADYGPMPIQIHTTDDFIGSVILEGTLSNGTEINDEIADWSPISGAFWTESTIDALFIQVTHIRIRIIDYISGSVSMRLGF